MDTSRRWMDDRGAVAVAGLAMAVFLTAIMYYEIGVGDAIYFKEQLQDASDSAGFAAAVYHAKGMNMIVVLNLIMAAVLAVIVVLKVLQLLFGIVGALAFILSFVPGLEWLNSVSDLCDTCEEWTTSTLKTMTPIVKTALQGLNDVETAVAVGMPWVSLIKSGTVGAQYYPQVTSSTGGGTIMLSMSLAPDVSFIPAVSQAGDNASESLTKAIGLTPECEDTIDGKRWGLPVSEGEFSTLCDQAGQVVPTLLEDALMAAITHGKTGSPPNWVSWINNAIGAAIGSFPNLFCEEEDINPKPPQCADGAADTIEKDAQTACNGKQTNFNSCYTELSSGTPPAAGANDPCDNGVSATVQSAIKATAKGQTPSFDMKGCMSEETESITKSMTQGVTQQTKSAALPMEIYSWAANGNDFMAIWSFGWGNFSNFEASGVSIAQWSKSGLAPGNPQHVTMLTKAEFYYAVENPCGPQQGWDEGSKGSSANCTSSNPALHHPFWGDYAGDTLWNPRWVARLRRVAPPMIPIGQMADSGVVSLLGNAMKKGFGMIPGVSKDGPDGAGPGWLIEFVTSWVQLGTGSADSSISGEIERSAGYEH